MGTRRMLAIDLGGSGGKCFAGIFRDDRLSIVEVHRFGNEVASFYIADRNGTLSERLYWDDIHLYQRIMDGLRTYRHEIADSLDSIGIDTWGTDGSFITRDGEFLDRLYCYRDHRLDNMIEEVKERIDPTVLYRITGIHFQPFNISNQLLWFMLYRRNRLQPGCTFLPTPAIFNFYLGNVAAIDTTFASVTQLMDARTRQWSDEVLGRLGIPKDVLPGIVSPGTIVGELMEPLALSLNLNRARLVGVGSHDTASAYAAAPVSDPAEALIISSGTWSLVGRLVPESVTTTEAMAANVSNEGGIGNIRLLKNCMGLWLVQELRRMWKAADGREMDWGEIIALVERAHPFTAFVDPDDSSFYNPADMEHAIADFCERTHQPVPKDRGTCLRVVYESLAMKYCAVNEEISRLCGKQTQAIHIVGGGCRNEMLNQFTADATGVNVFAGPEEATAVGNILVQAMALGIIGTIEEALPVIRETFEIKPYLPRDPRLWRREYTRFIRLTP